MVVMMEFTIFPGEFCSFKSVGLEMRSLREIYKLMLLCNWFFKQRYELKFGASIKTPVSFWFRSWIDSSFLWEQVETKAQWKTGNAAVLTCELLILS
jgi:hypothetical protein